MRARQPDIAGTIEVDGVSIAYESFGHGDRTILLMPTWCVVPARAWKHQVPYLSRHFRVVTWDGAGNGDSDRPLTPEPYTPAFHVRGALRVLDELGVAEAVAVASSGGTHRTLLLGAEHPDRIPALVFVGPASHLLPAPDPSFIGDDLDFFLGWFMAAAFAEPHSTKAREDGVAWGHGTTTEILRLAWEANLPADLDAHRDLCRSIDQPVLVIQGTADQLTPPAEGEALVDAIGDNASLVLIEGAAHRSDLRDPVRFSLLLRDFVERATGAPPRPPARWSRGTSRRRRALYLSSPIGLGHARRDLAIADELRARRADLEIDWLAQHPVTRVLTDAGEMIHPASAYLAEECTHMLSESAGHALHCFEAWRRMDELLVANFMVLHDVLQDETYDLVIADEAWEVDHFLHENPELKRCPLAWLTDFVGWLPEPEADSREAALTADANAEMLAHIDRYPWVRDASIFVGDPDDVVSTPFGDGLPSIHDWTAQHFSFPGYITGFAPVDRDETRAALGYRDDGRVCIATVGGSGIGTALLRAILDAFPMVHAKAPDLRLHLVTGPGIDPASLGELPLGTQATSYVNGLYRHLAACDLALVQGGLTTAMELTANQRPFLYFPLRHHFEQQIHVPHRLDRYKAGTRIDLHETTRDELATTILEELDRPTDYVTVETDGAARAATIVNDLL